MANATPPSRTQATHRSVSTRRASLFSLGLKALLEPLERPRGVVAHHLVAAVGVVGEHRPVLGSARVAERDERVPAHVARIVPGDVETVVAAPELVAVRLEPLHERHVRLGPGGKRLVLPPALDASVPGADVLADVAAVDLAFERLPIFVRA